MSGYDKSENGGFVALLTCVQKKMVCPERNIETDKFFNFKNTLYRKEYLLSYHY
jgi:hypothetical protein